MLRPPLDVQAYHNPLLSENPMSTILILGATGTVGQSLTSDLAGRGHTIRAATRDVSRYAGAGEPVVLDLSDPSTFIPALEEVDRVFLLSPPGHADQHALLAPFVDALPSTLERVVLMTAQGVDADESIPFRQLELHLAATGLPHILLRPSWFAQNFHTFWGHGIRNADILALPAGDAAAAFIDARDIAASAAGALTREDLADAANAGEAFVLTGPEALTHHQAAAILSEAAGRTIRYQPIDDDAFRAQLAPSGLPADYIELLVGLFAVLRMGAAAEVNDAVRRLSGADARSLQTYAHDYADALMP